MNLVESSFDYLDYELNKLEDYIKKIDTPLKAKKILQIIGKISEAIDLYEVGHVRKREVTQILKGTVQLIGFYGLHNHLVYWVYLFSKENMDQKKLQASIEYALRDALPEKKGLASALFTAVMEEKKYRSKREVKEKIKTFLKETGCSPLQIEQVMQKIVIQQQSRSLTDLFCRGCFTFADAGSCLLTMDKWRLIDLSLVAAKVGGQSPVFAFVMHLGSDLVLGGVATAGLIVVVQKEVYAASTLGLDWYFHEAGDKRELAYAKFSQALLELAIDGLDLMSTAAPLLFTLSPASMVALALIAKTTALVPVFMKE